MGSKLGGANSIIQGQDWLTELYLKNGETTLRQPRASKNIFTSMSSPNKTQTILDK